MLGLRTAIEVDDQNRRTNGETSLVGRCCYSDDGLGGLCRWRQSRHRRKNLTPPTVTSSTQTVASPTTRAPLRAPAQTRPPVPPPTTRAPLRAPVPARPPVPAPRVGHRFGHRGVDRRLERLAMGIRNPSQRRSPISTRRAHRPTPNSTLTLVPSGLGTLSVPLGFPAGPG
jgi:hypothetical protein